MAPGDLEAGRRSLGERTNTMAAIRKLKKAVEAVIRAMGQVRGTDPRRRSGPARRRPGRSPVQRTCFSGRRTGAVQGTLVGAALRRVRMPLRPDCRALA